MSTKTEMFRSWPAEALELLRRSLEADNSNVYWTAHKDVEPTTVVLSPMKAILAEIRRELEPVYRGSRPFLEFDRRRAGFSRDIEVGEAATSALVWHRLA